MRDQVVPVAGPGTTPGPGTTSLIREDQPYTTSLDSTGQFPVAARVDDDGHQQVLSTDITSGEGRQVSFRVRFTRALLGWSAPSRRALWR